MVRKQEVSSKRWTRILLVGVGIVMAGCGRDAPLHPRDAARPPDRPSALLNPLCAGTGGTTHTAGSISTAVTWAASGNPHRVTGMITLNPGGLLTVQPGVIVCFDPQTGLRSYGGRLVAQGSASSPIVLTARDPALGWYGVSLQGLPPASSYLAHARVEYASLYSTAVAAYIHPLTIDSTIVRQSGGGVRLEGRSRFRLSRVDTTTNRGIAAVTLGDSAGFDRSVILHAAGIGMQIDGTVRVGVGAGRIEGSGGVGIRALQATSFGYVAPVRVIGSGSYGIETSPAVLRRLYGSLSDQDSLKGNARDTVLMMGGPLNGLLHARAGMPWRVAGSIDVGASGTLRADPGSLMVLDPGVGISTHSGGRVEIRGTSANPVVLTASDRAFGWDGLTLNGTPTWASWITNARVEHVAYSQTALVASATHPAVVDTVVFRQNGRAVSLLATGSRLTHSRVDTTLSSNGPAVELGANAILESTLVRASSREGVAIRSATVQVRSCEVRESVTDGIVLDVAVPVHNCNLVDNLGVGVRNLDPSTAVDATNVWWGDAGGPTAPAGDGVAGAVTYTPWRTTPFVLPYVP
jgi:hypothetical protein